MYILLELPNINKENYNMMMDDFSLHFPESFEKIVGSLDKNHEDYVDYTNWKSSSNI
tara:strand:+ start:3758 stop:3928 length:171 start_codon:yes stop_codon:yes gene_type:complete